MWKQLKLAFQDRDGDAYYRYPIFAKLGRGINREPDVLIADRALGVCVVECKGCTISNIESVVGHEWRMKDFYSEIISPMGQAEDQMFAVKNKIEQERLTRNLLSFSFFVALPFIRRSEWQSRKLPEGPSRSRADFR